MAALESKAFWFEDFIMPLRSCHSTKFSTSVTVSLVCSFIFKIFEAAEGTTSALLKNKFPKEAWILLQSAEQNHLPRGISYTYIE